MNMNAIEQDKQFTAYTVKSVDVCTDGTSDFGVSYNEGPCMRVSNPDGHPLPRIDEELRLYGKGFGYVVRGIVSDRFVYYYRMDPEESQKHAKEGEILKAEQLLKWESSEGARQVRYASLPHEFVRCIDRFDQRAGWGPEFGPYELMVCEQAAAMAKRFGIVGIKEFAESEYDDQVKAFPELDPGHSGNSFGAAVHLARVYLDSPEMVHKVHGALCPLVGCEEYGCWAVCGEKSKGDKGQ